MKRPIKKIHDSSYSPIADLITYRALPSPTISQLDPFLFLNHHGYQEYPPGNSGLPFGPHPHRGMETVTFIVEGDIMHKDSAGHESTIEAGGVQWMTAGRGLIHAEVSSSRFKQEGGKLEILQLWLNLPARQKMTDPYYRGLQRDEIPVHTLENGRVKVNVLSGSFGNTQGAFKSIGGVMLSTIEMEEGSATTLSVAREENIFFYVIRGLVDVNGSDAKKRQLVEFEIADGDVSVRAKEKAILIFGHALPLNEPVVSQGPFVMNTMEEIEQAYDDFNAGKFGRWNE
jgi:redox-sensitive bicupin YhaK (pirin superfamily)